MRYGVSATLWERRRAARISLRRDAFRNERSSIATCQLIARSRSLVTVKILHFILAVAGLFCPVLPAEESEKDRIEVQWQPLKIAKSRFPRSVSMMDEVREDYATNLAALAVIQLRERKGDKVARELAMRMMSVALHLSPRNKMALVVNVQLGRGVVPQAPVVDREAKAFSVLMRTTAQVLEKQGGRENIMVAGYLFQLATDLDPKNEDAIYLSELYRINHGEVDWGSLLLNGE